MSRFDVDLAQLFEDEPLVGGEEEDLPVAGALAGVARENGSALDVELLLLEVREDFARARDHGLRAVPASSATWIP